MKGAGLYQIFRNNTMECVVTVRGEWKAVQKYMRNYKGVSALKLSGYWELHAKEYEKQSGMKIIQL